MTNKGFSTTITSSNSFRYLCTAMMFLFFSLMGASSISAGPAASLSTPRLVGTVEGEPFSGAVFDDGTGVQTFYRLHEQLPDGSFIVKVRSDSIAIKKSDGSLYEIFTSGTANTAATALPAAGVVPTEPNASRQDSGTVPVRPHGRLGRPIVPEPNE